MKLRNLGLIVTLLFASVACAQTPKTEYNAGICSPRSVGVYHVVMDGKKLSLDYYLDTDGSIVKDDKPLILDYTIGKELDKSGALPIKAEAQAEGHKIVLEGLTRKDRIAALVSVDGHLAFVYYGVKGSLDDLPQVKDSAIAACIAAIDSSDDLPKFLTDFLLAGDEPKKDSKDLKAVEQ